MEISEGNWAPKKEFHRVRISWNTCKEGKPSAHSLFVVCLIFCCIWGWTQAGWANILQLNFIVTALSIWFYSVMRTTYPTIQETDTFFLWPSLIFFFFFFKSDQIVNWKLRSLKHSHKITADVFICNEWSS